MLIEKFVNKNLTMLLRNKIDCKCHLLKPFSSTYSFNTWYFKYKGLSLWKMLIKTGMLNELIRLLQSIHRFFGDDVMK